MKKRILKKHVGRPIDFTGWNRHEGIVCHGRIDGVKNGVAVIEDATFPGISGAFRVLMDVRSDHIVEIY